MTSATPQHEQGLGTADDQIVHVDRLLRIDDRTYLVSGWFLDAAEAPPRLTLVSPDGGSAELLPNAWRHPRPDIGGLAYTGAEAADEAGFVCLVDVEVPSHRTGGWIIEMRSSDGAELEAEVPPAITEPAAALDAVLDYLDYERLPNDGLRVRHLRPAVAALLPRLRRAATIDRLASYGRQPDRPAVSIIVPLYSRIDLVEHQLAALSGDQDLADVELIYVLDSPELDPSLQELAPHLHLLYDVSFRTVSLRHSGGFANASNVGVAQARGDRLLLMNSDVLPSLGGWLSKMVDFYERTDAIGALGPKLLFGDGTLQHAGLYFAWLEASGLWDNRHYYKGLDGALPQANLIRQVPAVTAACMLTDAAVFRELGGLSGEYIQGDYEDSDYCLRLSGAGRSVWYLPEVELYHLEGQSYPDASRQRNGAYNRWLHTHLWDTQIEAVMARIDRAGRG